MIRIRKLFFASLNVSDCYLTEAEPDRIMAGITLRNVFKRYDNGFVAVDNANVEIANGEFMVLVGPSGCGKSTTLRMIAGLESVSSGDILIGDRRVNELEPGDRDIAMVFQNYALYPHMSVAQNLSFGLRMRKAPRKLIEKRVSEAARVLTIESLLDRKPRELSGGQRQRVAIGRAIVRDPAAFLFDEPLSNLDAKLRVQMRTELARLHQRLKTTTVYVTHDQVEAMTLGDRIVVMKDGVIQQIDTPLNLYHRPANRFVAGFIGSPSMNFLQGSVAGGRFHAGTVDYPLHLKSIDGESLDCELGFRPEALTLDSNAPLLANTTVEVVERMGNESIVYFSIEGSPMVARLNGDSALQHGDEFPVRLPHDQWHLFNTGQSQSSIANGQTAA